MSWNCFCGVKMRCSSTRTKAGKVTRNYRCPQCGKGISTFEMRQTDARWGLFPISQQADLENTISTLEQTVQRLKSLL